MARTGVEYGVKPRLDMVAVHENSCDGTKNTKWPYYSVSLLFLDGQLTQVGQTWKDWN